MLSFESSERISVYESLSREISDRISEDNSVSSVLSSETSSRISSVTFYHVAFLG